MANARSLPSGRVTFAFVDVVGSTRTFHEHGEAYVAAQRELTGRVTHHTERTGGVVVATEGDGAFLAFGDAGSAVAALVALQGELESADKVGLRLRLRSGAHTGDAVPVDGNYLAVAVHVAARVAGTANAGQVLVTDAVAEELDAFDPVEVGTFSLKDLPEPTRIWRVAGDPTPPRATPARRTNVSDARTSFVGRVEELDRLRGLVADPGLVTVVGPGGTGKTRLVSELAVRDAEAVPGGVWLAELASLEAPHQVGPAIGAALGLPAAGLGELQDLLRARGRCLLVLDNCEHLLDGVADVVEDLLAACSGLTVLCTSREALNLAAERVWELRPLQADGAATQLFLDRAADASESTPDLDLVYQLCSALDGLPLAIELAAGQVRAAPLREILAAVTAGSDALERRGGENRQRSLDAVLQWSLDRLSPEARASLLVLSVFPGRFSPDMGKALLTAAPHGEPAALKALARGSLVDLDGSDYRLLSTIRDAARRQLELDPGLKREAMDALAGWAGALGEERYLVSTPPDDIGEDMLLALQVALDHGLQAGTAGLGRAWRLLSSIAHGRGAGEVALSLSERAVRMVPDTPDTVAIVANGAQILEQNDKDSGLGPETFEAMRSIAVEDGDLLLVVLVLHTNAIREGNNGRWAESISLLQQALTLTESHEVARFRRPSMLVTLAHAYYYAGDRAHSIESNLHALGAAAESGQWVMGALAHLNLAQIALIEDRREDGRDHALAALKDCSPNFQWRGGALATLARALSRLGETTSALVAGREALPLLDAQQFNPEHQEDRELLLAELPELRT